MGNKKNKIAIINSVCGIGSTGRICVELSSFLETNGFETSIYFGRHKEKNTNKNHICFSSLFDNVIHCILTRIFDNTGFNSIVATKKLIKKLNSFSPNLIILNNLHGYYINIDLLLNWIAEKNIKTILVCHDCWNFTGHCAHFDLQHCDKWKSECHDCPLKKDYPASFFIDNSRINFKKKKRLFSNINCLSIVSPSVWMADLIKQSFLGLKNISVINNGIDTDVFKRRKGTFKRDNNIEDKKIILCIANIFNEKKGFWDVLKLSKLLSRDEIILMVGKIKIKKKYYLPSNILHIDRTDNLDQLVDIYSSSDIMFNPTYEDTYSNTNLEALSCETPVVCYKTGGAKEMVNQDFLVEQGNIEKSYQIIKNVLCGKIAYTFNKKMDYSKRKMHNQYLQLINNLLKE